MPERLGNNKSTEPTKYLDLMAVTSELMQNYLDSSLNGKVEEVLRCLELGVNINITDHLGRSSLMLACINQGNAKTINTLLHNGINVFALDNEGNSALDYAQQNYNAEAELLIRKKLRDQNNVELQHIEIKDEEVDALLRQKELETIIKVCDELKSLDGKHQPYVYFKKAKAVFALGHIDEGKKLLKISKQTFIKSFGGFDKSSNWSADEVSLYKNIILNEAETQEDDYQSIIWLYHEAYELTSDPELKYEFKDKKEQAYHDMVLSYHQHNLKVAYIADELPNFRTSSILSLQINELGNFNFPEDKPKVETLYAVHPFDHHTLYPLKNAYKSLFEDQLNELITILQNLGATSIKVEYPKGVGNVEYTFTPTKRPALPARLTWYNYRPQWQALAKQRLEGALHSSELSLISDQILDFSNTEIEQIQKEVAKLQGIQKSTRTYTPNHDHTEFSNPKLSCKVLILFEDTNKLNDDNTSKIFSEAEVKVDNTKTTIKADDQPVEQKDVKTQSDVTKSNASTNVESKVTTNIKPLIVATMSETEEKRSGFSQEERYYYEMLQRAHQDGPISEEIRKVLERRRTRFKISRDRADDIESIMLLEFEK